MKLFSGFILAFILIGGVNAQSGSDKEGIENACMGYIEGFYEGDSLKIIENVRPTLTKFGYWKNEASGEYKGAGWWVRRIGWGERLRADRGRWW